MSYRPCAQYHQWKPRATDAPPVPDDEPCECGAITLGHAIGRLSIRQALLAFGRLQWTEMRVTQELLRDAVALGAFLEESGVICLTIHARDQDAGDTIIRVYHRPKDCRW